MDKLDSVSREINNTSLREFSVAQKIRVQRRKLMALCSIGIVLLATSCGSSKSSTDGGGSYNSGASDAVSAPDASEARPSEIICTPGGSVYGCQARWTDGKTTSIEFPNSGSSHTGQSFVSRTDTSDNYGNPYCVSLFADGQGAFSSGTCGGGSSNQSAKSAVGIRCVDGSTLYQCEVTWSDGSVTGIVGDHGSTSPVVASTSFVNMGSDVCVNLHSDGHVDSRYC